MDWYDHNHDTVATTVTASSSTHEVYAKPYAKTTESRGERSTARSERKRSQGKEAMLQKQKEEEERLAKEKEKDEQRKVVERALLEERRRRQAEVLWKLQEKGEKKKAKGKEAKTAEKEAKMTEKETKMAEKEAKAAQREVRNRSTLRKKRSNMLMTKSETRTLTWTKSLWNQMIWLLKTMMKKRLSKCTSILTPLIFRRRGNMLFGCEESWKSSREPYAREKTWICTIEHSCQY